MQVKGSEMYANVFL